VAGGRRKIGTSMSDSKVYKGQVKTDSKRVRRVEKQGRGQKLRGGALLYSNSFICSGGRGWRELRRCKLGKAISS